MPSVMSVCVYVPLQHGQRVLDMDWGAKRDRLVTCGEVSQYTAVRMVLVELKMMLRTCHCYSHILSGKLEGQFTRFSAAVISIR